MIIAIARIRRGIPEAIMALLALGFAAIGPSWPAIRERIERGADRGGQGLQQAMPNSPMEWGVIGVVAAFVFLAIGGWISLRGHRDESADDRGDGA